MSLTITNDLASLDAMDQTLRRSFAGSVWAVHRARTNIWDIYGPSKLRWYLSLPVARIRYSDALRYFDVDVRESDWCDDLKATLQHASDGRRFVVEVVREYLF